MAKATFVQLGKNIDYAATEAVEYMQIVPLTSCVGVALEAIEAGGTGTVTLEGVYDMPAASAEAIDAGAAVYYNATDDVITATATGNTPAGMAVAAKTASATTARVRIG